MLKRRYKDPRFKVPWPKESIGAIPFTARSLSIALRSAGFLDIEIRVDVPMSRKKVDVVTLGLLARALSPYLYLSAHLSGRFHSRIIWLSTGSSEKCSSASNTSLSS
jgi:hypothetical protein